METSNNSNILESLEDDDQSSASHGGGFDEQVFCSVYLNDYSTESECLDIAGESAKPLAPLLGYECSGRWNQLFQFNNDCTISATQPEFIGRVRGYDTEVTVCLDATKGNEGVLTTNPCINKNSNYTSQFTYSTNATQEFEENLTGDAVTTSSSELKQPYSTETRPKISLGTQRFAFLPQQGERHKVYLDI